MGWTKNDRTLTPTACATQFAATAFEQPRALHGHGMVEGRWNGRTYDGVFRLQDGTRLYRIQCDEYGTWRIDPMG